MTSVLQVQVKTDHSSSKQEVVQPETLAERLSSNPRCDVCTSEVTSSSSHTFNGFDLLCEKCFCHRYSFSYFLFRIHFQISLIILRFCSCQKPLRPFALKIVNDVYRDLCGCDYEASNAAYDAFQNDADASTFTSEVFLVTLGVLPVNWFICAWF